MRGALLAALVLAGQPASAVEFPAIRQNGFKQLAMTAQTEQDQGCRGKPLPYARLLSAEAQPQSAAPGQTISHRIVYAYCPAAPRQQLDVSLSKRLTYKGKVLVETPKQNYRLRPGTWADDDLIPIPADAPAGRYEMRVDLIMEGTTSTVVSMFDVR
ncbi:MAG: hypothetical protein U1E45_11000 [Geminicoccaceae bacterium]